MTLVSVPILHWSTTRAAKQKLREGASLREAAEAIGETPEKLDLSLWRQLGAGWPK